MQSTETFTASDGISLHLISCSVRDPLGVILLVHGLGEHSGRYASHLNALNRCGFSCFAFDLRGHGLSDGKRGHIPSYDQMLDDIEGVAQFIFKQISELPFFVYGHSFGGNLVFNLLLRRRPQLFRAAVITSPWIRMAVNPPIFKQILATILFYLFPGYRESNNLDPAFLSRDPEVGKNYSADPLVHDKISARLYISGARAGEYITANISKLKIPVLLIHGSDDPITLSSASEEVALASPGLITYIEFPGMLHETHNELDSEKVRETICRWVTGQL